MAAVINDGLELYARELQQINTRRSSQPVAASSGSLSSSLNAARPPRAPSATGRKASNFYPSSLPKGGHSGSRSRPFGQSPPSVSVGWLLGSSPGGDGSGLLGSSPGSRRASPRHGSLLGSSLPIPKFQHPSHSLLEENGFTQVGAHGARLLWRVLAAERWGCTSPSCLLTIHTPLLPPACFNPSTHPHPNPCR